MRYWLAIFLLLASCNIRNEIVRQLSHRATSLTKEKTQLSSGLTGQVTWSIYEGSPAGGTVSPTGLYTAPATPGVYHVIATSVDNPQSSNIITFTVCGPTKVDITCALIDPVPDPVCMDPAALPAPPNYGVACTGPDANNRYVLVFCQRVRWVIAVETTCGTTVTRTSDYQGPNETWTATGGTVDSFGHYTAPKQEGTYEVKVTL